MGVWESRKPFELPFYLEDEFLAVNPHTDIEGFLV